MGAENVWSCICMYRKDKAKELIAVYGNRNAIVRTLERYPQRDSYHGHGSSRANANSGTNHGADENLDRAIEYLETNAPQTPEISVSRGPNQELRRRNERHTDTLLALMSTTDNLGELVASLDLYDSDWESDRSAWSSYSAKYKEKKNKDPKKRNQ